MEGAEGGTTRRLVVDRFEGDLVVVEVDGGPVRDLPRWLLPVRLREGDVIEVRTSELGEDGRQVVFRADPEATRLASESAGERLQRLRARDPGGDIAL